MAATVRPVVRAPHPVLAAPAADVDPLDPQVAGLAADLVATMRSHPGCVGLAAVQVGVGWRLFCLDVGGQRRTRSYAGLLVLANPCLVESAEPAVAREGCLSVPELTGDVARFQRVTVRGVVPGTGEERVVHADGYEAVGLQHEIDHCDGLLFLDRVAGAHAVHARRRYR